MFGHLTLFFSLFAYFFALLLLANCVAASALLCSEWEEVDPSRYYHLNAFAAAPLSFLLRFAARGAVYLRRCIDGQAANDC